MEMHSRQSLAEIHGIELRPGRPYFARWQPPIRQAVKRGLTAIGSLLKIGSYRGRHQLKRLS